eukprot:gnl/Chilomastix_cuspidata/3047.p1 GENE.gnl/Chilomastix_cuspidata/3047~~gnl/Chilomastix_cuspidata/3047.p1  ORF type:complete len:940 (-),score=368.40 gnl/Chilomastix_cuspidata/3047:869-3688(-)
MNVRKLVSFLRLAAGSNGLEFKTIPQVTDRGLEQLLDELNESPSLKKLELVLAALSMLLQNPSNHEALLGSAFLGGLARLASDPQLADTRVPEYFARFLFIALSATATETFALSPPIEGFFCAVLRSKNQAAVASLVRLLACLSQAPGFVVVAGQHRDLLRACVAALRAHGTLVPIFLQKFCADDAARETLVAEGLVEALSECLAAPGSGSGDPSALVCALFAASSVAGATRMRDSGALAAVTALLAPGLVGADHLVLALRTINQVGFRVGGIAAPAPDALEALRAHVLSPNADVQFSAVAAVAGLLQGAPDAAPFGASGLLAAAYSVAAQNASNTGCMFNALAAAAFRLERDGGRLDCADAVAPWVLERIIANPEDFSAWRMALALMRFGPAHTLREALFTSVQAAVHAPRHLSAAVYTCALAYALLDQHGEENIAEQIPARFAKSLLCPTKEPPAALEAYSPFFDEFGEEMGLFELINQLAPGALAIALCGAARVGAACAPGSLEHALRLQLVWTCSPEGPHDENMCREMAAVATARPVIAALSPGELAEPIARAFDYVCDAAAFVQCARLVSGLLKYCEAKEALVNRRLLQAFRRALADQTLGHDEAVREAVWGSVWTIATVQEGKRIATELGFLPITVAHVGEAGASKGVVKAALKTLWALLFLAQNGEDAVEHGVVEATLSAARRFPEDKSVQHSVLTCLKILSRINEASGEYIVAAGGLEYALECAPDRYTLQTFYTFLIHPRLRRHALEHSNMFARGLLNVVRAASWPNDVLVFALKSLRLFATCEDYWPTLVEHRFLEDILDVATRFPKTPGPVVEAVLRIFAKVLLLPGGARLLCDVGCIAHVTTLLQRSTRKRNKIVEEFAVKILFSVAAQSPDLYAKVQALDVLPVLEKYVEISTDAVLSEFARMVLTRDFAQRVVPEFSKTKSRADF